MDLAGFLYDACVHANLKKIKMSTLEVFVTKLLDALKKVESKKAVCIA